MKSNILRLSVCAAAIASGLVAVAPAQAVALELGLAIDDSGSISNANFLLQKNGYVSALGDPTVIPLDGSVAIGVYKFATTVTTVFSLAVITSANINSLIAAINGMTHQGGSTNISGALTTITADIMGNLITSDRQVIDVSTDGGNNIGNLATARAAALAAGIDQINCIGIGGAAECNNVIGGTGSFELNATFDNFESSLRAKITREVSGTVPEPASWSMMIAGFGAIGYALRRARRVRVMFA